MLTTEDSEDSEEEGSREEGCEGLRLGPAVRGVPLHPGGGAL